MQQQALNDAKDLAYINYRLQGQVNQLRELVGQISTALEIPTDKGLDANAVFEKIVALKKLEKADSTEE